jgi:hypothetical protein
MSSVLQAIGQGAGFLHRSAAPLDTDGAHDTQSFIAKEVADIVQIIKRGPAFTVAGLVSMSVQTFKFEAHGIAS